ncbi:hypothetical protein CXT87_03625 [Akkermansia muciniphila]|nr:hypothetical protein CXT93_04735 [Akkermansia muciniphila]PND00871.1 hypothetical protein CXT87_03625 [Akkermansia muciniphila]PND03228.1 hypothetical protein CXT86_09595 [Akkermansia muciniphila]PND11273.1 hypothetical protein CXT85_01395 [Akkermansia muciniphila]
MHARPAVAGLFPGAEVGLVSRLWRRCRLSRTDADYQGMAGAEKGFREEADGNHAVAAWLNGG